MAGFFLRADSTPMKLNPAFITPIDAGYVRAGTQLKEESKIIELDTVLEYRDGQVYIKKMVTSEMPVTLTFALVESLNKTIVEYYKKDK